LFALTLWSCSILDKVIFNDLVVLKDGESRIFKLEPGTYKLEITASADGVSVEWIGSNCQGSGQTNSLTTICKFMQTGQLIVKNPTGFGMGATVSATIKLTKLARDI
jgi:hypothetical protein